MFTGMRKCTTLGMESSASFRYCRYAQMQNHKRKSFTAHWMKRLGLGGDRAAESSTRTAITASPDVRVSAHGDGLALLHVPSGRVYVCNSTASRIWKGLLGGRSPEAVSEEISRDYGVVGDLARQDTAAFVSELESYGFLVRA